MGGLVFLFFLLCHDFYWGIRDGHDQLIQRRLKAYKRFGYEEEKDQNQP
jgi:hypothetical protein